jgi:hypothetical protein
MHGEGGCVLWLTESAYEEAWSLFPITKVTSIRYKSENGVQPPPLPHTLCCLQNKSTTFPLHFQVRYTAHCIRACKCRDLRCQLARTDRFICKVLLLWGRPSIEAIAGTEREKALKDEQGVVCPFMAWERNMACLPLCLNLKFYFAYPTTDKSLPK